MPVNTTCAQHARLTLTQNAPSAEAFLAEEAADVVAVVRHRLSTRGLCDVKQAVAKVQALADLVASTVAPIEHGDAAGNLV